MIAAGSLFTSCIEPVEPAGIFDLREAKARYYDALSKLRAADADLVEAQAETERANAQFQLAMVENQNLLNEYQRLVNEAKALNNEQEAAKWAMLLENLQKQHELDLIDYQQKLAEANEKLRQALSKIEMAMLDLTDAEKLALTNAITRYENAYDKWQKAQEAVTKAEADLWDWQYNMDNGTEAAITTPSMLSPGNYCIFGSWDEYYQSMIDYYTMYAEYYAAWYEEMENNSDFAEWADELESLKAERDAALYDRYKVTKDSVEYMMNTFHDGNLEFILAVKNWMEDEDHKPVADPGKAPAEPKESSYPAKNYYADSIKFPVLEYETPNQAYDKFRSLISSYETVSTLVGDTTNFVIVDDGAGKITLIANQQMKDFVLGTAAGTTGSQKLTYYDKNTKKNEELKADYGLNGAISVLERVLVLDKKGGKTQEELEKDAEDALKLWKADRDSIIAIFDAQAKAAAGKESEAAAQAYQPIKDALAALKAAKDEATSESGSLVKAAEKLATTFNGMILHSDMSVADSTNMIAAFVEFAKAREAYLDYTPYQNGTKYDNKNMFYFPRSTSPDVIVDSIAFTDITFAMVDNTNTKDQIKGFDYNYETGTKLASNTNVCAFFEIAKQLLGEQFAKAIDVTWPGTKIDATVLNDYDGAAYHYTAFYGDYKYDNSTDPAQITKADGSAYTPKAVTDAIDGVTAAVAELNNLWARFWGENLSATDDGAGNVTIPEVKKFNTPAVAEGAYDPRVYELESFTKPFNVVVFDGANINWTAAIGAILGSVDPNKGLNDGTDFEVGGYVSGAAIFAGALGTTDFYDYMYKAWLADNNDSTEEIAKLKEWVAAVVAAFEKDVTDAQAAAKKAYDDAVKTYNEKVEKYNKAKAAYDKYMTALKAFVGVDEDGEPINVKPVSGALVPAIDTIHVPVDYECKEIEQTQTGAYTWTAEWILGGEQLELAKKYLPDYPENLVSWRHDAAVIDHKVTHLDAIIDELEKAYIAAAKVYDEAYMGTDFDFSIEDYFEDYLDYIYGRYIYYLEKVEQYKKALAKYEAGYDPKQIQLEILEHELALAELKLADAEAELAAAKAYYDKVLAHIEGKN